MATPFTHTGLQTTLARPGQSGSGKTSSPATIGTRDPGTGFATLPVIGAWKVDPICLPCVAGRDHHP